MNSCTLSAPGAPTSDKVDWATYILGTEQIVGTWIDGKTIYRRVFQGKAVNASEVIIASLGTAINCISVFGWFVHSSGQVQPIGQFYNAALGEQYTSRVFFSSADGYLKVQAGSALVQANYSARAIIEYTKE